MTLKDMNLKIDRSYSYRISQNSFYVNFGAMSRFKLVPYGDKLLWLPPSTEYHTAFVNCC